MGYKVWTRERLPVTEFQQHVQDQVVMRFASASQRGTLLPNPQEGMVSYLEDVNRWEGHDGSGWQVLSWGKAPVLRVERTAPQLIPVNAWVNVVWDFVHEDTHGMMNGANPYCRRSGLYQVTFGVSAGALGGRRGVRIFKQTGAATPVKTGIGRMIPSVNAAEDMGVEASGLARFASGDLLLTQFYQDGTGSQNTSSPDFSPTKLDMLWVAP